MGARGMVLGGGLLAVALALAGLPATVVADDSPRILTTASGWDGTMGSTGWYPVTVAVGNSTDSNFTGTLALAPDTSAAAGKGAAVGGPITIYSEPITVPRQGRRQVSMMVPTMTVPTSYQVDVVDQAGRTVASEPVPTPASGSSLLLLSEGGDAAPVLRLLGQMGDHLGVATSGSASAIGPNAIQLSGLDAIVIEDFDSTSLSQVQLRVLRDYVAMGGQLILAPGPGWRRSLLPLPKELVPMVPSGTDMASLSAIADLADRTTTVAAPIVVGTPQDGVRAMIADDRGLPLLLESTYGAGNVLELTFDPGAQPVATSDMAALSWTQAIDRALATRHPLQAMGKGSMPVSGVGYVGPEESMVTPLLQGSGDGPQLPPAWLLGGLLALYVGLAGLLNYLVLSRLRRRELMWVTVPTVAVVFCLAAYWAGIGSRGGNFIDSEIQIFRVSSANVAEVTTYHSILASRGGDFSIQLAPDSLARTPWSYGGLSGGEQRLTVGPHPEMRMLGVPIWSSRGLVTERTASLPQLDLATDLSIRKGRVMGKVTNRGSVAIHHPTVVIGATSGTPTRSAELAVDLAPGGTLDVNQLLGGLSAPGYAGPDYANGSPVLQPQPNPAPQVVPQSGIQRDAEVRQSVGINSVNGRAGQVVLVGSVDPVPDITVDGTAPNRHSQGVVLMPIEMASVDPFDGGFGRIRLVSRGSVNPDQTRQDVYEVQFPGSPTGPLSLTFQQQLVGLQSMTFDLYDWDVRTWRSLAVPTGPTTFPLAKVTNDLRPGEIHQGTIRVRVRALARNGPGPTLTVTSR